MDATNWVKYKIEIREGLRLFALNILLFSEKLPSTQRGKIINYQITKSGTSTYPNYRAALRGRFEYKEELKSF
jgi:hypothetical protein